MRLRAQPNLFQSQSGLHRHLTSDAALLTQNLHMTVRLMGVCRSGLPPSLDTLVVISKTFLAVTLAPAAPEPRAGAVASLLGGTGVRKTAAAAATRHVRLDALAVELRSSPAGSVAGAATGLSLAIHAHDVLLELPPGVSTDGLDRAEGGVRQRKATAEHMAAWIASSGARSVRLEPRRRPAYFTAAGFSDAFPVSFKVGKRQGTHLGSVFSDADDLLRSMTPLCAQHRLSCSGGTAPDGSAGGVLIERLL